MTPRRLLLQLAAVITLFFFFNDTATTEIYTLSLHDALPISRRDRGPRPARAAAHPRRLHPHGVVDHDRVREDGATGVGRSEEHTSELQSRPHLVCRLLLEKKNGQHFGSCEWSRRMHFYDTQT